MAPSFFVASPVVGLVVGLALGLQVSTAHAQDACEGGFAGCASAAIAYHHHEALPVEFNFDTGWVPAGSPVQVRFHAALIGHTQLDLAGQLTAGWPEPMVLQAVGTPGGGSLAVDYGVQFMAQVRLSLDVEGQHFGWEGNIPYLPSIDFRAMATQTFDPWAWDGVMVHAMTPRVHLADVNITSGLVHIPGIGGGLTFDASGDVDVGYHSTQFEFGLAADPITRAMPRSRGIFMGGPFVEYQPRLDGEISHTGTFHVHPGLYITLLGRRWMIDLIDIPIPIGPFTQQVRFDPATAHLGLPLVGVSATDVDFGDVPVGTTAERSVYVNNTGEALARAWPSPPDGPFGFDGAEVALPVSSMRLVNVTFTPVSPGAVTGTLAVLSNDPTTPRIPLHVRGNGLPGVTLPPPPDASVADDDASVPPDGGAGAGAGAAGDGSCGCAVPGHGRTSARGALALLGLAIAASRARRRGRRPG